VYLEAPQTVAMPYIGLLGAKYVFSEWRGTVSTTSNALTLTIDGDQTDLTLEAIYTADYTMMLITVGVITVIAVVGFIVLRKTRPRWEKLLRRKNDKKPPPPVVKPNPMRHS
jgi:hypothetical protein